MPDLSTVAKLEETSLSCIDTGSPTLSTLATDFEGGARVVGTIDRGADELLPNPFIRGDCNGDGGVDVADPVQMTNFLFVPGSGSPDCEDACDANDDGTFDLSDVPFIYLYLLSGGPPPTAPFPGCGTTPTPIAPFCVSAGCP